MNTTFIHAGCEVRIKDNTIRISNADGEYVKFAFDSIGSDEDILEFARKEAEFFAGERQ